MSEPQENLNTQLEKGTGYIGDPMYPEKCEVAPNGAVAPANGLSVHYSPTLGKLALALSQAQLNFKPIKKQVENTFYFNEKTGKKAMYADLASIIEATQKPLAEQGLVVIQFPITDFENKRAGIVSKLIHSSDEWCEVQLLLPATSKAKRYGPNNSVEWVEKFDAQTIGAAQTYARRYTYGPVIGVSAEEDNDANEIGEASSGSHEAQKAVAEKKIKAAVDGGKAALFYSFDDAAQTAYITGDVKLMTDNKELLLFKGKWDKKSNAVVTDSAGLEDMKYELEQRGVIFRPLKGTEVAEALRESIAQAKAKKNAE